MGALLGTASTWPLYVPLYWSLLAVAIKRYHDQGRRGWWLLLLLIPIIGPLWVVWSLGFRKGMHSENRYGAVPHREQPDYLVVRDGDGTDTLIYDITRLDPVEVRKTVRPTTVAEAQHAIGESTGPISIGGGRFSMGGQISSPGSLHIDTRGLNGVVAFSPTEQWIRVQSGIRWCDIQRFLDPHNFSVKIMQSYANLTVGGSLNVNAHGRYMGLGPVILSVRAISIILADGTLRHASPRDNAELFYAAIGGYGGLGLIAEVELDIVPNTRVMRVSHKMAAADYTEHFNLRVRPNRKAVFHNADLYPPHYSTLMAQTWEETDRPVTQTNRLMTLRTSFPLERYFMWAISETPMGKWRREFIFDPILSFRPKVHWRNYEASYDIAELGTNASAKSIYALQEYFVPVNKFHEYLPLMRDVLQRHGANMINISIRHAIADPGSTLAWAREEVFAFVMYYKQGLTQEDRNRVAIWTRELIDAVLRVGGTYYLPYQAHATPEQFHRAYPRANEFFGLKRALDPHFRFRNVLWDKYYAPTFQGQAPEKSTMSAPNPTSTHAPAAAAPTTSEFKAVFSNTAQSDGFYQFLQNIFHIWPEDKFHALLKDASAKLATDKAIYEHVQASLPSIKPFLQPLTYALPALTKQKREMSAQTVKLLGDRRAFNGYLEIGSTGRYISDLRKHVSVTGPIYLTNDIAPSNSPGDMMERGQLGKLGTFFPLDYAPLDSKGIPAASVDLATCYIGLHHCPPEQLDAFVKSVRRVLRPGGLFVMRDHDVRTPEMANFVSLVHTVFNLGLDVPWATNEHESKTFKSADGWAQYVVARGFRDLGPRLLQQNDPSDNTLMAFVKTDAPDSAGAA